MVRSFAALILVSLITQGVWAENPLEGTWKVTEVRCKSGTPSPGLNQDNEVFSIKAQSQFLFTSSTLEITIQAEILGKPDWIQTIKEQIKDIPDSEDKTRALASIMELEKGKKCNLKSTKTYTVKDNLLMTVNVKSETDCEGESEAEEVGKQEIAEFSITENTLTVTDGDSVESETGLCPLGDNVITVLERMK